MPDRHDPIPNLPFGPVYDSADWTTWPAVILPPDNTEAERDLLDSICRANHSISADTARDVIHALREAVSGA